MATAASVPDVKITKMGDVGSSQTSGGDGFEATERPKETE